MSKRRIFTAAQVDQTIKRMAYEVLERNSAKDHILFIGLKTRGMQLVQALLKHLKGQKYNSLNLRKNTVWKAPTHINNDMIILVDDVLNTGKSLARALCQILTTSPSNNRPKAIEIMTLVERTHKHYPIEASYRGWRLPTTLDDYVNVVLDNTNKGVYLS